MMRWRRMMATAGCVVALGTCGCACAASRSALFLVSVSIVAGCRIDATRPDPHRTRSAANVAVRCTHGIPYSIRANSIHPTPPGREAARHYAAPVLVSF